MPASEDITSSSFREAVSFKDSRVEGFPLNLTKKNAVWVLVDRLTKSTHFLPVRTNYSLEKSAKLYMSEIVRLYSIPMSIVSDRDPRFTLSTTFHPQTNGQSKRVIQVLKDSSKYYLSLAEFTYNNNHHASLGMSHFEALYGRRCKSPTCWLELN
ncbi:Transposon Ty3-I Gag-Pol polyprotein [Gossypium australe]|uniref:Transposon Ty3-I Gag-Pol polyprotein n=1 Tax=Gossypium australe TaxID=47621 RepID=A0A5B6VLP8_9ROSI|nr:Transposon Ty3-I Gag-Pol polyprotein [Gossypium australe]